MPLVRFVDQDMNVGSWRSFMTPQKIQRMDHWLRQCWRLVPESRRVINEKGQYINGWQEVNCIVKTDRICWTVGKQLENVWIEVNRQAGGMGR